MSTPAVGAMGASSSGSLSKVSQVSSIITTLQSINTHLHTRLASQTALEVGQSPTNLIAHRRLAMLSSHSLGTTGGRRAVSASATDARALGSQRAFASMAVVANTTGVCCRLPGRSRGAGDWVSGSGLGDSGVLCCLLACQTRHEAGLCGGGGGACAGHGRASCVCIEGKVVVGWGCFMLGIEGDLCCFFFEELMTRNGKLALDASYLALLSIACGHDFAAESHDS